jgi:ubiquinone biosynthesis accessory factor UbiK
MKTASHLLDDLQSRIGQLLRSGPAADVERNVRAALAQGFQKMDLVTREEFEVQRELLQHTQERLRTLEARVADLEAKR